MSRGCRSSIKSCQTFWMALEAQFHKPLGRNLKFLGLWKQRFNKDRPDSKSTDVRSRRRHIVGTELLYSFDSFGRGAVQRQKSQEPSPFQKIWKTIRLYESHLWALQSKACLKEAINLGTSGRWRWKRSKLDTGHQKPASWAAAKFRRLPIWICHVLGRVLTVIYIMLNHSFCQSWNYQWPRKSDLKCSKQLCTLSIMMSFRRIDDQVAQDSHGAGLFFLPWFACCGRIGTTCLPP